MALRSREVVPKPPSPPADVDVPKPIKPRPIEPCPPHMKFECNGSRCGCIPPKPPSPPADKPPSPPVDVEVPVKVAGKCFLHVHIILCVSVSCLLFCILIVLPFIVCCP